MMRVIELRMDEAVWERVKRVVLDAGINLAEFAQVSDQPWDEDSESWAAIGRQQLLAGINLAEVAQTSSGETTRNSQQAEWERQERIAYQREPDDPAETELWLSEQVWEER